MPYALKKPTELYETNPINFSSLQVKVWFQNRRTKHKRMQQEDDGKGNGNRMSSPLNYEDDELIDMEMDDCPSDEEECS